MSETRLDRLERLHVTEERYPVPYMRELIAIARAAQRCMPPLRLVGTEEWILGGDATGLSDALSPLEEPAHE